MASNFMTSSTDWSISNDIYSIVNAVDDLKKKYVEDEDETTLALGIFGFLGDTEAKKIQTAVIMAGELGNEMFPQRAKLDKNIVTHAMYSNIEHLNAVPAHMQINLMIREEDLDLFMVNDQFILDHMCPIYIEDYEFHLDYDILIKRGKNTKREDEDWIYTATYQGIDSDPNPISDIRNPYLPQPYRIWFNNYVYILMTCTIRQVSIELYKEKMITDSVINNKSLAFNFMNQLSDFVVYVTEKGYTRRLTPLPYGSAVSVGTTDYCWYMYINDSTIRITFDSASYIPGLNADVDITVYNTFGLDGNFKSKVASDIEEVGYFIDFETSRYRYKTMQVYVRPSTDSVDGQNKKSTEDLKKLLPKMALSRGFITTETDLNNYFNLISTEDNLMKLQKKVDNQLNRIWYCYMLAKDDYGNIIPTNTIPIRVDVTNYMLVSEEFDRYVIPAGTCFKYDASLGYGVPVDESTVPTPFTDAYFANDGIYWYRLFYNIIINKNPLFCSYNLTLNDISGYFEYVWLNDELLMGFVIDTYSFKRKLLSERNIYTLEFGIQQSMIDVDYGLYKVYEYIDDQGETHEIIENNVKVFVVLYDGDEPYRYVEATLEEYLDPFVFKWKCQFITDDKFDSDGKIKITNMKEVGTGINNDSYLTDNCRARVYIFGKFDEEYGRYDADGIIPGMYGYSLINIYEIDNGLDLFSSFTNVMNTRIRQIVSADKTAAYYSISGIPVVGEHYLDSEDNVSFFVQKLLERKAYIDNCLKVIENNMDIDFKYFNTYGYSQTYTIGDKEGTPLGNIDITMRFRLKLANSNDSTTRNAIILFIKEYIEDLNELGDLHIPNLIHDVTDYFADRIVYIEFMNFNDNRLGVNHIELKEVDDIHTVPEFISVRNQWNVDHTALEPCIDMEVVV